ncbi:hypothetical protein N0V90_012699 [Kalmusia sp. IMI 367209]|nr:hypothetical protein N0V90_012699 [Kalmusia sp. IMI 367209]
MAFFSDENGPVLRSIHTLVANSNEMRTYSMDLDNLEAGPIVTCSSSFPVNEGGNDGNFKFRDITPEEAKMQANERATSIYRSYDTLREILKRYEEVIRQRWTRKKRELRKRLLLEAWPNMSASHRPDIQAYIRESDKERRRGTAYREAYVWPSVNLEDLSQANTVLRFLNSRGRHSPSKFAILDLDSVQTGIRVHAIKRKGGYEIGRWFMDLKTEAPEKYGRISEYKPSKEKTREGELPNVSNGLLVLEIQDRILSFLVKLCGSILHDKQIGDTLKSMPVLSEPADLPVLHGEWPSAIDLALERPYIVPQKINIGRLRSLAEARLKEWRDHALEMREDPAYFRNVYQEWADHCPEHILDYNNRPSPELSNPEKSRRFWNRAALRSINEIYDHLFTWIIIASQLRAMERAHKDTAFQHPEDNPKYIEAMGRLKVFQEKRGVQLSAMDLMLRFTASPPIRGLFSRKYSSRHEPVVLRSGKNEDDPLFRLASRIQTNTKDLPRETLATELSRLVQFDKKQKDRISPMVMRYIDYFSTHCELRAQLRILCPQIYMMDEKPVYEQVRLSLTFEKWFDSRIKHIMDFNQINEPYSSKLKLFGEDIRDARVWDYPINKKRTEERTKIMQRAEKDLDMAWEKFDKYLKQGVSENTYKILNWAIRQHSQLQRTPDWVKPERLEKKEKQEAVHVPLPTNDTTLPFRVVEPKTKVKTKGELSISLVDVTPAKDAAQAVQPQQVEPFELKRRAYRVFSILFFQISTSNDPGEVPWVDFVYAMNAIGLSPEKLYGSVWRFAPNELFVKKALVENPINFHEPHPEQKLSFFTARRYGRRLNRTYGLDGSCFVLRGEK